MTENSYKNYSKQKALKIFKEKIYFKNFLKKHSKKTLKKVSQKRIHSKKY